MWSIYCLLKNTIHSLLTLTHTTLLNLSLTVPYRPIQRANPRGSQHARVPILRQSLGFTTYYQLALTDL